MTNMPIKYAHQIGRPIYLSVFRSFSRTILGALFVTHNCILSLISLIAIFAYKVGANLTNELAGQFGV